MIFILLAVLFASPVTAVDSKENREHQIKAAFLYNFIKFVDWPEEKMPDNDEPVIIGVIGDKDFVKTFDPIKDKQVKGKKVIIKLFDDLGELKKSEEKNSSKLRQTIEPLKKCHIVFLCICNSVSIDNSAAVIDALKGSAVLTAGEQADFLENGGNINFLVEKKKVRFEINLSSAKHNKLKIRSQLLRLAKRVIKEEKTKRRKRVIIETVRNMTIKQKLTMIIMLTCIVSLLLVGTIFVMWGYTSSRKNMINNLLTQAEMIADNCKASVAFDDPKDAEETLNSLRLYPSIVHAHIHTNDGKNLAGYYREDVDRNVHPLKISEDGYSFDGSFLTVSKSIVVEDETIASLCLRSDLKPLHTALTRHIYMVISVLVCISLVAYLLSIKLQGIISGPILELAEVAGAVSEKKDYSARATRQSNDEVGLLIDAFNHMLEKIQQRDSQLVDAKGKLEIRVEERTAELTTANKQLKREITERKEAEERQAQLLEELENINRELKDFAYIVSHDLKAPLRGIKTLVGWISSDYKDKLDDKGEEQFELLSQQVHRMHNLIEGILQYSRVGREDEERVEINLNELIAEVIEMVMAPENISVTIENKLPVIKCERTRVTQVFQNLLVNAIKYMDKPEGRITVGCLEEGGYWKFSVADNGPGIEEQHFERIFKIFKKLSGKDDFESTGIGLTIVKKIVELYKGKVWVESEVGKGSTFFFTLSKHQVVADTEKVLQSQVC